MRTFSIEEIKQKARPVMKKYGVEEMYLFGSYARGEACEDSDLDFAVQDEGAELEGMRIITFKRELENAFGIAVDLIELDSVYTSPTRFGENRLAPKFERDKVLL
jgi:hypothetical protein